jgi:hypothetical protein
MNSKRAWLAILVLAAFALAGCSSEYGKVIQAKVISYDKEKKTVHLILEGEHHFGLENQVFDKLPPVTFSLPTEPMDMGPEPRAGMRMLLDTESNKMTIYDKDSNTFKNVNFAVVDKQKGVDKNDPRVQGKSFPIVDKDKKTLTVYSSRWKTLMTFALPDEYLGMPPATWDSGDIVRIYYKEDGKALRFMNVSKTDIFKK